MRYPEPRPDVAKKMNPKKLKFSLGNRVVFWGGMDEQQQLPPRYPEEVAEQLEYLIAVLGDGGG